MKRISLGETDFKEIIDKDRYLVDKTLIIKEFLEDSGKIVLLPRPRRFGKTFNLSILRYFLERTDEDRSYLFKGLNIEKETDIMKDCGKYPLIYLTFKDEKHSTFEEFLESMQMQISSLYKRFYHIYDDLKFQDDKDYYDKIINRRSSKKDLEISLFKLSEFLNCKYNQKVIILIDEYDTPIHEGYFNNYYTEIIGFMRNFLSAALKDNINLEKAMITGILFVNETPTQFFAGVSDQNKRQAFDCLLKESIFSGLNNLKVYTLLNEEYSQFFGFTTKEIDVLLKDFDCKKTANQFKEWYNGYKFGKETIYNPWSTMYYLSDASRDFKPYWVNTSENSIIKSLLAEGDEDVKLGLETLYNGEYIETTINEDTVMSEISDNNQNLWSFLLLSGYLKATEKYQDADTDLFVYKLTVPNKEVRILYRDIIEKWFKEGFISSDFNKMLKALVIGEVQLFEEYFSDYVMKSFSYFDISGQNPERVYHAFILGMLVSLSGSHEVISNRESGLGRYDVSLIPKDISKPGIIMEFKSIRFNSKDKIQDKMDEALQQVNKKFYDTELKNRGIKNIIKLALVFKGKEVMIEKSNN